MLISRKKIKLYGGYFLTLFGGLVTGIGIGFIVMIRILVDSFGETSDPIAYSDIHILAFVLVILGLVSAICGLYQIRSSQNIEVSKIVSKRMFPPQTS